MGEAKRRFSHLGKQLLTILIDTLFLIAWIGVNWFVTKVVKPWWDPEGADLMMFNIFQFLGSAGTLIAIGFSFYVDLMSIYYKSRKDVSNAKKKFKQ